MIEFMVGFITCLLVSFLIVILLIVSNSGKHTTTASPPEEGQPTDKPDSRAQTFGTLYKTVTPNKKHVPLFDDGQLDFEDINRSLNVRNRQ